MVSRKRVYRSDQGKERKVRDENELGELSPKVAAPNEHKIAHIQIINDTTSRTRDCLCIISSFLLRITSIDQLL